MKKATRLQTFGVLSLLAAGLTTGAQAAALETVGASGTHATISAAIAAVDDNGVVEIVDAGTYNESINLSDGPANYTIRKAAAVVGVVTITNGSSGLVTYNDPGSLVAANSSRTLEGLNLVRNGGSGTVVDVDQSDPGTNAFTLALTINNCILEHTGTTSGDTGEVLKIDDGFAGGAAVTITVNDSILRNLTGEAGAGKATIRVQDTTWENLFLTVNNSIVQSGFYRAVRSDGGNNQNMVFNGCTIEAGERGIVFDDPHDNSTVSLINTTITAGTDAGASNGEVIYVNENASSNNKWEIIRSTLDTDLDSRTVSLTYAPPNELNVYNSILYVNAGSDASSLRALNLTGFDATGTGSQGLYVYNNTFVGEGAGAPTVMNGSTVQANFWNNLILNFDTDGGGNPLGGSYSGIGYDADNNIIVGTIDDSSRGSNGSFIDTTSGGGDLAAALAAAGLDSNFQPQTGSAAIGAGAATNAGVSNGKEDILTTIGNVDKDNVARANPPAVGALEPASNVQDWLLY